MLRAKVRDEQKQIRFTDTLNVFRRLKGFTTILEVSNILNLYSVEVCCYQKEICYP